MSVTDAAQPYVLRVEHDRVLIGKYAVPIGRATFAQINPGKLEVRLSCIGGAMGRLVPIDLDFQLQSIERIREFVAGLLRETEAYFVRVAALKTAVIRTDGHACVRAEFSFPNLDEARMFTEYLAPVCFPLKEISLNQRTVTILSEEGAEDGVIERMRTAFALLNLHTNGTLNDALSVDRESPFWVPRIQRPHFDSTIEVAERNLCYKIGPEFVQKEVAMLDPLYDPQVEGASRIMLETLTVNAAGAKKRAADLQQGILEIIARVPAVRDSYQPLLALISPMAEPGAHWDEVDMEVFRNRCKTLSDPVLDHLDGETRREVLTMFDQLLKRFRLE